MCLRQESYQIFFHLYKMIQFENCPVSVNNVPPEGDGFDIFASNVSFSENLSIEYLSQLGVEGKTDVDGDSRPYPTAPPNGTVNIDFYISGSNDVGPFLALKKYSYQQGEGDLIDLSIGPYSFSDVILTSYGVNATSNEVITANMSLDFYGELQQSSPPAQDVTTGKLGHGSFSAGTFESLGFLTAPFSFSYSFDQSYEILRGLGSNVLDEALWREGSETISAEGYDLPTGVAGTPRSDTSSTWFFPKSGPMEFIIKDICGKPITGVGLTGFVTSRDVSISEDNVLNGSIEVSKEL